MTETQILQWIKQNLGPVIKQSIAGALVSNPDLLYTEDWLVAIACRETGQLIAKRLYQNPSVPSGEQLVRIAPLMTGDYSQREGETEKTYHGFGFWQADIGSFPDFIKSGLWKIPAKACAKAIAVLEDKRIYIVEHFQGLTGDPLARAITAAYNCGEGNVKAVLNEGHDIDIRTTEKNYSADVWRLRSIYQTL